MKPEVVILTTCHPVDDVRVYEKVARSLKSADVNVAWVGPDWRLYGNSGDTLPGVSSTLFRKKRGRIGRVLSVLQALRSARATETPAMYYCPEPDAALIALWLARWNGARVLLDLHEVYHGDAKSDWGLFVANRLMSNGIQQFIRRLASRCNAVMGVNSSVIDLYATNPHCAFVVRNTPPRWYGECSGKGPGAEGDGFRVMHGKAHVSRGTKVCLDAMRLASSKIRGLSVVMFKTSESDCVDSVTMACGLSGQTEVLRSLIDLRPAVRMTEMPRVVGTCDCGLILYGRGLGRLSLPNRLFEYMAAGVPVIAPVYSDEITKVLCDADCGLSVDAEDPGAVSEAIVRLWEDREWARRLGQNGRAAFLDRYSWESEFAPVLRLVENWVVERSAVTP